MCEGKTAYILPVYLSKPPLKRTLEAVWASAVAIPPQRFNRGVAQSTLPVRTIYFSRGKNMGGLCGSVLVQMAPLGVYDSSYVGINGVRTRFCWATQPRRPNSGSVPPDFAICLQPIRMFSSNKLKTARVRLEWSFSQIPLIKRQFKGYISTAAQELWLWRKAINALRGKQTH